MEQFTFYEFYADILQSMDDVSAGKLVSCICAYEFEEKEPVEELSDNITYTPWKLKSNTTAEERAKFERERPYYEMRDGGNNIYKYITADRKLNGENSKSEMRDMIAYIFFRQ